MEKEELKTIGVRLPVDTIKALKMYCALTDKKLQNVINDAIVEKLKWEYFNTDVSGAHRVYFHIIELLPHDEMRPDYRANRMEKVFKDPSGRELFTRRTKEPIPFDKKRESTNMKRKITTWKNKCIKDRKIY